jgi:glutathione S-transferase
VYTALEHAFVNFAERVKGPFLAGDEVSTGDLALAPFIGRLYLIEDHRGFSIHRQHGKLKGQLSGIEF